jgi:hypothetical protein
MANIHTEWQASVSEVLNLSDVLPHVRLHLINLRSLGATTVCHSWPAQQLYVINAVQCTKSVGESEHDQPRLVPHEVNNTHNCTLNSRHTNFTPINISTDTQ